jgi:hypothetical protein
MPEDIPFRPWSKPKLVLLLSLASLFTISQAQSTAKTVTMDDSQELFLLPVTKNGPNNEIEYLKDSIAL